MSSIITPTKTCTKCGKTYPATKEYFHAAKGGKYGLRGDCIFCNRKQSNEWALSEHGKEWRASYYKNYPEKINGRRILANAVNKGIIPPARSLACVRCGKPARQYHHWHGYNHGHELDVIPVCMRCHRILENETVEEFDFPLVRQMYEQLSGLVEFADTEAESSVELRYAYNLIKQAYEHQNGNRE